MSARKNPVCCCRNQGLPYDLNGVMVISRDPACHFHEDISKYTGTAVSVSVETVIGNWKEKEVLEPQEREKDGANLIGKRLSVPCPTCGVNAGQYCIRQDGIRRQNQHPKRGK